MKTPQDSAALHLPFWINGTLEPEAKRAVQTALDSDPALAQEARALANLRAAMQAEAPAPSPGEFGLARLMRDIQAESPATAPASKPWRAPGFAQGFALAAAVAGAAALLWPSLTNTPMPEPVYEQAAGAAQGDLLVSFADTATATQISELLLAQGLVILDGPSAVGLYRLGAYDGATPDDAVTQLEQSPAIVTYVERTE